MAPKPTNQDNADKAKDNGDKTSEEKLALLYHPSAGSTDRPSLTNLLEYGSLTGPNNEGQQQTEPLIQMRSSNQSLQNVIGVQDNFNDEIMTNTANKRNRKQLLGVLAALVVVASVFFYGTKEASENGVGSIIVNPFVHHPKIWTAAPFSQNHPVDDMHLESFPRPQGSSPPDIFTEKQALPTNSWYQNLLLVRGEPNEEARVYPMPYVVDVVGPVPGVRVHHPSVIAGATVVQLTQVLEQGLTVGAVSLQDLLHKPKHDVSKAYQVTHMTALGVTLEWNSSTTTEEAPLTWSSSIVKGMPYATMTYHKSDTTESTSSSDNDQVLPSIISEVPLGAPPVLDGQDKLTCSEKPSKHDIQWVQGEIQVNFHESDYTWLIFVSRPTRVQCITPPADGNVAEFVPGKPVPSPGVVFALQFLTDDDSDDTTANNDDFIVRVAMSNACTYGGNPTTCGVQKRERYNVEAYSQLLRDHANYYPGPNTHVTFDFDNVHGDSNSNATEAASIIFDWDVKQMHATEANANITSHDGLLMFALPHHQDMIDSDKNPAKRMAASTFPTVVSPHSGSGSDSDKHMDEPEHKVCRSSLLGPVCLLQGATWNIREERRWTSFRAPRPPHNDTLPALAKAYRKDLEYLLPSYYRRGAGDTYFSGKMLAKLGRILTIGEELHEICSTGHDIPKECEGLDIPSTEDSEFQQALAQLTGAVQVWVDGTAETPFVYDDAWGGVVSCGCDFKGNAMEGKCRNSYPDCPGFSDPGLNFGNAFYNDHHFHLGYHIYAAAVVAHFDPKWGRDHFEDVLLLVRDIANPSHEDTAFPLFRNKDWYQGSSWASGIAVSPLNGRNQESSSEAIAAYEGVALFGLEMTKAFEGHDKQKLAAAREVHNYGEVLSASEIRSADRYWHVIESSKRRQYPVEYTEHAIGMLWNTMAQFQTWFGSAAYLATGIQLLPLTAASEDRDSIEWARELYEPFAESCSANGNDCRDQGWSVLVLAILATVGHHDQAVEKALELPHSVFESAGGNGHSLTNTLWYLATRPIQKDPLILKDSPKSDKYNMDDSSSSMSGGHEKPVHDEKLPSDESGSDESDKPAHHKKPVVIDSDFDCGCPETCNKQAWDRFAIGHSCGERIQWLITKEDRTESEACHQVGEEFPGHCAACDPEVCSNKETFSKVCPPCSKEVCADSKLNLCPINNAPFLCTEGKSTGGCSPSPWPLAGMCESCCELLPGC